MLKFSHPARIGPVLTLAMIRTLFFSVFSSLRLHHGCCAKRPPGSHMVLKKAWDAILSDWMNFLGLEYRIGMSGRLASSLLKHHRVSPLWGLGVPRVLPKLGRRSWLLRGSSTFVPFLIFPEKYLPLFSYDLKRYFSLSTSSRKPIVIISVTLGFHTR